MKLLIISDIHSNIDSLEAILKQEKDSDIIYCAGDLVDVGFHPKEVLDCIRANGIITVKGNHDELVIQTYRSGKHLEDIPNEELTWPIVNARELNEEDIVFLEELPDMVQFEADGITYCMQHFYEGYKILENHYQFSQFWLHQTGEDVDSGPRQKRVIVGHTHRQIVAYVHNDRLWMNPGSVGYNRPDDPSIAAHYITITDGRIELKQLVHEKSISRTRLGELFAERFQSERGSLR